MFFFQKIPNVDLYYSCDFVFSREYLQKLFFTVPISSDKKNANPHLGGKTIQCVHMDTRFKFSFLYS